VNWNLSASVPARRIVGMIAVGAWLLAAWPGGHAAFGASETQSGRRLVHGAIVPGTGAGETAGGQRLTARLVPVAVSQSTAANGTRATGRFTLIGEPRAAAARWMLYE